MVKLQIPPNTIFFEPDGIHRVIIQFPDQESAILFSESLKQVLIENGAFGEKIDG